MTNPMMFKSIPPSQSRKPPLTELYSQQAQ